MRGTRGSPGKAPRMRQVTSTPNHQRRTHKRIESEKSPSHNVFNQKTPKESLTLTPDESLQRTAKEESVTKSAIMEEAKDRKSASGILKFEYLNERTLWTQ